MSEQRGLFEVFKTNLWIEEDCVIKTCNDGVIYTHKGAYRCRDCRRNNFAMPLIPLGMVQPKYTAEEMTARRDDRYKVVTDSEFRHKRSMELISAIKEVFRKDKVKEIKGSKYEDIEDEEVPF